MKAPLSYRKGIPFFCSKTATEYRQDAYEHYDQMVVRQSALHLADELWGGYPLQAVLDFGQAHYTVQASYRIVEIGCGVGRWIGSIARHYPDATCWGIDYSYQMLKRAREAWIQGQELSIDLTHKGFPEILKVRGNQLSNLQLGLAKASLLPFANNSQDLVLSSFLLDRLDHPDQGLREMHRILQPQGQLVLISPLNFKKAQHWSEYYPPSKLAQCLTQIGFDLLHWQEDLSIHEPLDAHGNALHWRCLGLVARKQ